MGCLGCQKLENDKYCVTLHTGKIVCNYCHEWLIECEANQILAMPLEERRKFLDQIEKKRGDITKLKQVMTSIFEKRKL